ncbi:heparan-alpha-glucosaminide N-acetyltransferase domain-containing protein [Microbacterium sp.]|uniref:heparan-alpha-glucosaminide N-acetyltransferase domain-containing protein n=1 Tax=Microbacterium sp. TaxID=51671 RepID=UPI0039E42835
MDLARGLAVIGMLAAHLLDLEPFDWSRPSTWADVAGGRSSILFAVLAGVSIALVSGGARPVPPAARRLVRQRLAVRAVLLWLLGIGLVITGVPVFVILPAYGILFLLTLPLLGMSARALGALAVGLALVMPWVQPVLDGLALWRGVPGVVVETAIGWHYPFPVWSAFIVAGLAIGRLDLRAARVQAALLVGGAGAAVVGYGAAAVVRVPAGDGFSAAVWSVQAHSGGLPEVVGSGGFAVATLGVCLLLCRTPLTWVLLPLRAVGSMPLTAYTGQLVVWAVAAGVMLGDVGDLAGFRAAGAFWPMTIGTVVGCTAWALLLGRGPLERVFALVVRLVVPAGPGEAGGVA